MPSFEVGARQYARELESLQLRTDVTLYNANLPYRERRFFEPREPIPGLPPEYLEPLPQFATGVGGGGGGTLGNYLTSAVSGINTFAPTFLRDTFSNFNLAGPLPGGQVNNFSNFGSSATNFRTDLNFGIPSVGNDQLYDFSNVGATSFNPSLDLGL